MKNTGSLNRLKGKKLINTLFSEGKTLRSKGLLLKFFKNPEPKARLLCGVSVGKRNFKNAVVRNKIKRQLRVVLHKTANKLPFNGAYMLIFKGSAPPLTQELVVELSSLIKKITN
jgi:ribonuclease P protein component